MCVIQCRGEGSVDEVLEGLSLSPRTHIRSCDWLCTSVIATLGERRQEDSWNSLAGQCS